MTWYSRAGSCAANRDAPKKMMQIDRTVVTAAFKRLLIVANTNVTYFRIYFGTRAKSVNELCVENHPSLGEAGRVSGFAHLDLTGAVICRGLDSSFARLCSEGEVRMHS